MEFSAKLSVQASDNLLHSRPSGSGRDLPAVRFLRVLVFLVDWFPGRKDVIFRELYHVIAIFILGLYVVAIIAFLPGAEISFFVPDSRLLYYWTGWDVILFFLVIRITRFAVGQSDQVSQAFDKADAFIVGVFTGFASIVREAVEGLASAIAEGVEWLKKKLTRKRGKA